MFPLICQAFPYIRKFSGVLKALLIFLMICWGCLRLRLKRPFSAAWLVNFWNTELTFLSKIFAKQLFTLANVWASVWMSSGQQSRVKKRTFRWDLPLALLPWAGTLWGSHRALGTQCVKNKGGLKFLRKTGNQRLVKTLTIIFSQAGGHSTNVLGRTQAPHPNTRFLGQPLTLPWHSKSGVRAESTFD